MKNPDNVARGRRSKQRSKTYEREWAAFFGTTRLTDARGTRQPDLRVALADGRTLALEVKSRIRADVAALVTEAIEKADDGELAALCLELRRPAKNIRLIAMERQTFLDLVRGLLEGGSNDG